MIHSFRLRLALLSALLAGIALGAFGGGSWWLIRNLKIEHIDSEVRTQAEREANRLRDNADWRRSLSRMSESLGIRDSTDLIVLMQDEASATLYQSAHWPNGLALDALPWPNEALAQRDAGVRFSVIAQARAAENTATTGNAAWLSAQAGPDIPPGPGPGREPRFGPQGRHPPHERPPPRQRFFDDVPPPRPAPPTTREAETSPPTTPSSDQGPNASPPAEIRLPPPRRRPPLSSLSTKVIDGQEWRLGLASTEAGRLAIGVNVRVIDADMRGIRNAFLAALPFALLFIGLGSWLVASRAMRPLKKLTQATRKVTAEGLDQRISAANEDHEFAELITLFNRMLERLERSFKQAQRFSADAAHELKTPLAILQGQLERAIHSVPDGSVIQEELSSILDEVRRLSTISRKLLLLAQADAGQLRVFREPVDLSGALHDLVEDTRMLAPELTVSGDIPAGIVISADGGLLLQVLHNLISNAIKYNITSGWIKFSLLASPHRVEIQIANASNGISPAERQRLFERFFRADGAHNRTIDGVGLGLSLSREIARAHGGDLTVAEPEPGAVSFTLSLPVQRN